MNPNFRNTLILIGVLAALATIFISARFLW